MSKTIHSTALIESAYIEENVEIWQYAVIRPDARIGRGSRICSHCYIDRNVVIGKNCKIKNGVLLYNGAILGDNVFVGPGAVFTNDPFPRADEKHGEPYPKTVVKKDATIGANATILPGVEIGIGAMVGAGAVVTKDVPDYSIVKGNPAEVGRFLI